MEATKYEFTKTYEFTQTCPICGRKTTIKIPEKDWVALNFEGKHVQDCTGLSLIEKEVIISGFCPECQQQFFGGEENDES